MRPPDPVRRAASSLRGFAVPGDIGEGRRTPPNLTALNPAGLKPAPPIPPAAHTLEGWYPRKYAYCTIYRK